MNVHKQSHWIEWQGKQFKLCYQCNPEAMGYDVFKPCTCEVENHADKYDRAMRGVV